MRYEKEIVDVLAKAGNNGLSVKKIARHVFNASNSFFEVLDFSEVHQQVQRCLLRNSKKKGSLFIRMKKRGAYRLNPQAVKFELFQSPLSSEKEKEEETRYDTDQSLSLFDEL